MNLVLGGIMIAMATVLGFLKLYEAPYGGAITVCSVLPILFYSYRCGLKWGLGAGLVNSVLQLLLGMSALRGLTAGTLIGSIFLDYILAFTVLGLGGMFRGKLKNDAAAFTLGSLVAMLRRYFPTAPEESRSRMEWSSASLTRHTPPPRLPARRASMATTAFRGW